MSFYNWFKYVKTEDLKQFVEEVNKFLIELDKFKNENHHKIYDYVFIKKSKYSQEYIARIVGSDQSTISRKLKEIQNYMLLKLDEKKYKHLISQLYHRKDC